VQANVIASLNIMKVMLHKQSNNRWKSNF
jgi:hypothetical protein